MLFSVFQNIVFTGFRQPFRYSYTVFFTCLNSILMVRLNNVLYRLIVPKSRCCLHSLQPAENIRPITANI